MRFGASLGVAMLLSSLGSPTPGCEEPGDGRIPDIALTPLNVSSFGHDADGELYMLGYRGGRIMRMTAVPSE